MMPARVFLAGEELVTFRARDTQGFVLFGFMLMPAVAASKYLRAKSAGIFYSIMYPAPVVV